MSLQTPTYVRTNLQTSARTCVGIRAILQTQSNVHTDSWMWAGVRADAGPCYPCLYNLSAGSFLALFFLPFGWRFGFCFGNIHSDFQRGRGHKHFEGDSFACLRSKNSRIVFILEVLVYSVQQVIFMKTLECRRR